MTKTIPPGLLAVQDLISRHPDDRAAILSYEIQRRERERVLYEGVQTAFRSHPWHAAKTVLGAGLSVFLFALTIGELSSLAHGFQSLRLAIARTMGPAANLFHIDLNSLMPSPQVLEYAAKFPAWDWKDALMIALAGMVLVLAEQLVFAAFTWKKTQALKEEDELLKREIETLKEWPEAK